MTTPLYPSTIYPLIGYGVEPIYYTQVTPTKAGADVSEKIWDTPRFRIRLPYRASSADASTVLNFHHARRGRYEEFDFIDFHTRTWEDVYVATGDGSTAQFTMPFTGASPFTVYVDGVAQTGGIGNDYLASSGIGTNGRDVITFFSGSYPQTDEDVTVDFTGQRYFTCRFAQDNIRTSTVAQYASNREYLEFTVELISQR